jgi:polyvinyl alcohol dehydrogenase (cytochrome)
MKQINVAFFVLLTLLGCSADEADTKAAIETTPESEVESPQKLTSTDEFQATQSDFGPREEMPGAAVYAQNCAGCHNGTVPKAPHFSWLEMMTPGVMLKSLNEGIMQSQAAMLDDQQRRQVVEYITRAPADTMLAHELPMCGDDQRFEVESKPATVGWGHDTSRFTPAEEGGIDAEQTHRLQLKWSFVYPGALRARSQPAVGWGAVYTGSQDGLVYAFDLDTGCVHWTFQASAEVRTAIVLTDTSTPLAVFGDILAKLYAVNALTGELVWSIKADDHPSATLTGSPALADDKLFVPVSSLEVIPAADPAYPCCSFRGSVLALDVNNGAQLWRHYTIPNAPEETSKTPVGTPVLSPSGAPVWSSPAVDRKRNRIYFGSGENYSTPADNNSDAIFAVDMTTGERVWQRQSTSGDAWNVACMMADNPNCPPERGPDFDHGASMILVDLPDGKQVLAVGHKNGTVFAINPDGEPGNTKGANESKPGDVLWSVKVGRGSIQGGIHFGMAAEQSILYAPINDMNDTRNGDELDPALARPGVHAIDMVEGSVLWQHIQPDMCGDERPFCDPGVSGAITAGPGVVFAGHLDGFVRAYAQTDGEVLWQYDTTQVHTGVNGLVGRGGSISGAGPTVAAGHLIVNSGYGLYFHEPGNVLLVFDVVSKRNEPNG